MKHVTRIGGTRETALSGVSPSVARDSKGNIYIIDAATHLPRVYTPQGRFLRYVGKTGTKQGELLHPLGLAIGSQDSMFVLDPLLKKVTAFSPSGALLRTIRLDLGDGVVSKGLLRFPNGNMVTNAELHDRSGIGFPLVEFNSRGERIAVFGTDRPSYVPLPSDLLVTVIGPSKSGLWAVGAMVGRPELYDGQMRRVRSLPAPDYFKPLRKGTPPSGGWSGIEPTMEVRGVWEDDAGLLWTATNVPAPNWAAELRRAPQTVASSPRRFPHRARHKRWNTIIDVRDPDTGALIVRRRIPEMVTHTIAEGLVASYGESEDGYAYMDILHVEFKKP